VLLGNWHIPSGSTKQPQSSVSHHCIYGIMNQRCYNKHSYQISLSSFYLLQSCLLDIWRTPRVIMGLVEALRLNQSRFPAIVLNLDLKQHTHPPAHPLEIDISLDLNLMSSTRVPMCSRKAFSLVSQ